MDVSVACIAGEEVYRQQQAGRIQCRPLPPADTPFGPSADILHAESDSGGYYLLARHGAGLAKSSPAKINNRANLYALKDMGVSTVLAWGPGAAVTHTLAIGDLVILSDLIDQTSQRARTFYENTPLGYLRQFPLFCPSLQRTAGAVLTEASLTHHDSGTAAVTEGPRYETPAEVRVLAGVGADLVTHCFAPEAFLAKELELCYAAVCYVVNYAETGSRHRPFDTGSLFGGLTQQSDEQRLAEAVGALGKVTDAVAGRIVAGGAAECECQHTLAACRQHYGLPDDWREWLTVGPGRK